MGKLDGKVAVVTGGASGIGLRVVELFVEEGARVLIGDLDADGVAGAIARLGHNAVDGTTVDVRDEDAVQNMVERTVRRFGRLDVAFNSAGIGGMAPIEDYPLRAFKRVLDVCLTGVFLSVKHESAQMIAQGTGGSIINVGSINSVQAGEGMAAYCVAKAGVAMLTKVAALELGRHQVRVNAIGPGFVYTPLTSRLRESGSDEAFLAETPMGRLAEPEDIARLALYLAADESSHVTGQLVLVDGGATLKNFPPAAARMGRR
jgi:NAD(P)-dependent dehydrogenase (short-subunit alcohol dehydrogenase family)